MAAGDRIIVGSGLSPGNLVIQEGAGFEDTEYGWDTGQRTYLTHPDTPTRQWPQKGDPAGSIVGARFTSSSKISIAAAGAYPTMFVVNVKDSLTECGFIELAVSYKGVKHLPKREKIRASGNVRNVIAAASGSDNITFNLPLTEPTIIREYITAQKPNYDGVGHGVTNLPFLPPPPKFDYVLRYSQFSINAVSGWVLQTRDWEDVAGKLWIVTETWTYKLPLEI